MANKLIRLPQLQRFKAKADAKYQNKLTAGSNITINNNVISASGTPTYFETSLGRTSVPNNSLTKMGELTLQPGIYYVKYSLVFPRNANGTRHIAISLYDYIATDYAYNDNRIPPSGGNTKMDVDTIINVSATDYPNGRTYYFLAQQTSGSALTTNPTVLYYKF